MKITLLESRIVRRYAQAYLYCDNNRLSDQEYTVLHTFSDFFKNNEHILLSLCLPLLTNKQKINFITSLQKTFELSERLCSLFFLLIKQNRIRFIIPILETILAIHQDEIGVMPFSVTTSHPVTSEQKEKIVTFLSEKTKKNVSCTWSIDTKLIGGIRAQSSTILWESSLRKKLQIIEQTLLLS